MRRQRRGELIGASAAAVDDPDFAGADIMQRHDRGAGGAARSQNDDGLSLQRAGVEIFAQRCGKAACVGVAPFDPAIVAEDQQIDGAGHAGRQVRLMARWRRRLPCAGP